MNGIVDVCLDDFVGVCVRCKHMYWFVAGYECCVLTLGGYHYICR